MIAFLRLQIVLMFQHSCLCLGQNYSDSIYYLQVLTTEEFSQVFLNKSKFSQIKVIETAGKKSSYQLCLLQNISTYLYTAALLVNYICDLERCSHQESLSRAEKYQVEMSLVEYEQKV